MVLVWFFDVDVVGFVCFVVDNEGFKVVFGVFYVGVGFFSWRFEFWEGFKVGVLNYVRFVWWFYVEELFEYVEVLFYFVFFDENFCEVVFFFEDWNFEVELVVEVVWVVFFDVVGNVDCFEVWFGYCVFKGEFFVYNIDFFSFFEYDVVVKEYFVEIFEFVF